MAKSEATTVAEYLSELPEDRRAVVSTVRDLIRANLPEGYREGINWGAIVYEVPLERYPKTYNKQPLVYAAIAAKKAYYTVHLNCVGDGSARENRLRAEFEKAGKKLDMGKACIRFKSLEHLVLDSIARVIAETPVDAFLAGYEASRAPKAR